LQEVPGAHRIEIGLKKEIRDGLGETLEELGGFEYDASQGLIGNRAPGIDAEKARSVYRYDLKEAWKKTLRF
jgi:hypothetical protein